MQLECPMECLQVHTIITYRYAGMCTAMVRRLFTCVYRWTRMMQCATIWVGLSASRFYCTTLALTFGVQNVIKILY